MTFKLEFHQQFVFTVLLLAEEDPCECNSVVKFQKKVEEALQALTKKYILSCVRVQVKNLLYTNSNCA